MQEFGCTGLVLRYSGGVISLLSPQEGRVEKRWYKPKHGSLHRGSLISYLKQNHRSYEKPLIQALELEVCATQLAFHDIYLLHYLLEVCYYYIPVGSEARCSFYFLVELFSRFHAFPLPMQKKSVLCKLFALLGICPDDSTVQLLANRLRQMPIDNLVDGTLELNAEELMNRWLAWCMEMHPKGKFFKAMPLLLEK